MRRLTLFLTMIASAFILSGCSLFPKEYLYVYPTYTEIIAIDKIPSRKIIVREDNTMGAESTANAKALIGALRRKEKYVDNEIYKANQIAKKKNKLAEEHNKKINFIPEE